MHYEIVLDPDPQNPRTEYECVGVMLYASNRYKLGDRRASTEEIEAVEQNADLLVLPVYAYIHGGTVLSTHPFGDRWDSGKCGVIYMTREDAKEWASEEAAQETLRAEVATYSAYLSGQVFGWTVADNSGAVLDSCYGYYNRQDAEQDAQQSFARHQAEQATKNEHTVMFGG